MQDSFEDLSALDAFFSAAWPPQPSLSPPLHINITTNDNQTPDDMLRSGWPTVYSPLIVSLIIFVADKSPLILHRLVKF